MIIRAFFSWSSESKAYSQPGFWSFTSENGNGNGTWSGLEGINVRERVSYDGSNIVDIEFVY